MLLRLAARSPPRSRWLQPCQVLHPPALPNTDLINLPAFFNCIAQSPKLTCARGSAESIAQHFLEDYTEGVHVRLLRQLLTVEVSGLQVAETTLHSGAHESLLHDRFNHRQSKVSNLSNRILVKQDVACLDAPVNDTLAGSGVKGMQARVAPVQISSRCFRKGGL